jgi:hypothetical protein
MCNIDRWSWRFVYNLLTKGGLNMAEGSWEDNTQRGAMGGTVFRGPDGSLYFVRDELLDALRVEGEGKERLEEALQGKSTGVETFAEGKESRQGVKSLGYVRGSLLRQDPRNMAAKLPDKEKVAVSTVMCPWFC